jgi:cytochrome bd-type quinol oxidase subunit 2
MGVLYKYTMLLVLPGLLVWALVWRGTGIRGRGARSHGVVWLVIGLLLLLASLLPIVLWNQQHGWTTLKHLFGHLGIEGGDVPATQGKDGWEYNPLWTLTLVGTQLGLVGPVLVLGAMGAIRAWRERANDRAAWHAASFLIAVAAPMYLFYLIVSFVAEPEGNWPLAGAVSLLPLAGRQAVRGWDDYRDRVLAWRALPVPRPWQGFFVRSPWTATSALWIAAVVVGIGLLVFGLRLDVVARLPGVSRVVPVGRFTGAQRMGAHAGRIVEELRSQSGQEPFVIAHHYGRASQLSYYMPGRPDVYCSSSVMPGGRVTPWDFWPELDLRRAVALGGRPALVVGLTHRHWEAVFERVEYVGALEGDHKLDKDGRPTRPAFRAYGFRGFPEGGVPEPDWGAAAEGGA